MPRLYTSARYRSSSNPIIVGSTQFLVPTKPWVEWGVCALDRCTIRYVGLQWPRHVVRPYRKSRFCAPSRDYEKSLAWCDDRMYAESARNTDQSFHDGDPHTVPEAVIVTRDFGRPESVPTASIALTTSMPSSTSPKTTCLPSSHDVTTVVMKNYVNV